MTVSIQDTQNANISKNNKVFQNPLEFTLVSFTKAFFPLKRYTKQVYASISLFILTAGKNRKASATLSHLIHLLLCKTILVRDA